MSSTLGIFVWATLIVGSGAILFLSLPDILFWLRSLRERVAGGERDAARHVLVAPSVSEPTKAMAKKRKWKRRR